MPKTRKKATPQKRKKIPSSSARANGELEEQDLPSDEAGRLKIKKNYAELLGIRVEKLRGRVLNREKISKSIEGIYFICAGCKKVCHSLDDGLVEQLETQMNYCSSCAKAKGIRGAVSQKAP